MAEIEVNAAFKEARLKRQKRRRQAVMTRVWIGGGAALAVLLMGAGVIVFGGFWNAWFNTYDDIVPVPVGGATGGPIYVPAIVDLAGDPMRISLGGAAGAQATRFVPRPVQLPPDRAYGDIAVLADVMITQSKQFMTTLPSSPKDFAFYQAQRVQAAPAPAEAAEPASSEAAGGVIENTTSVAVVRPESVRFQPVKDYVGKMLLDRTLQSVMAENNFAAPDADVFATAMEQLLAKPTLYAGDVVAVRGIRTARGNGPLRVVQVSLYDRGRYLGTLSRSDQGDVVLGADPWVFDELFNYTGDEQVADPGRQYRLLDAIYSTAARNSVPTSVLGEAIMLLSRSFDLNAFASTDDKLILAYANDDSNEGDTGRILYVSVRGTGRNIECYVFKLPTDGDYSCFTETSRGQSISMPAGMVSPVRGVLVAPFGPGVDPVTKQVVTNTGIDWAAPEGTPVVAAFGGTVGFAAEDGNAGNVVRVTHGGGRETSYGHLQAFANGIAPGKAVRAGDVIGYVGTTGVTLGPQLHFELILNGTPIDPLQAAGGGVGTDDEAVTTLVNQIVKVESGGNATAKNPLSSAFGLGQFINSTWLRMMRTYRPDLASSMSEADLLALRSDPTLAREMVANLAREGEAYLKSRGHQISAGRLYLCHFLGMEGADIVLKAEATADLQTILGAGVIGANPFLAGRDAAWVIDWAERKMSGARGAPQSAPPIIASPEFRIYQAAIQSMMAPEPVLPGQPPPPPPAPGSAMLPGREMLLPRRDLLA